MNLNVEQRFQRALARIREAEEKGWPKGYPKKAQLIQDEFDKRRYGTKNLPPAQWEFAVQMACLLEVIIGEPEEYPEGLRRRRWEEALEAFDMETGKFPDTINPRTGEIIEPKR